MPPLARWHLGELLPLQSMSRLIRRIWERDQKHDRASQEDEGLLGNDDGTESLLVGDGEGEGRGRDRASYVSMVKGHLTGSALRGTIAGVCGVAFLLFGYDQGVLGAVIGLPSFRKEFNNPNRNLEGIIAGIYDIGCFIGAIVAFLTADRFGRKGSIMWGSWIMVVGTILQTSATENVQMILSRTITGIGNGINTVNVPIWQAESFKSNNRGAMLVIQSALIAFGHPLSTFMGLASSQADPSSFAWRWPIAFQGFFLIIILCMLPLLPESPRWLVQHDRVEEATEVFARLEGKGATLNDDKVIRERDMVVASVQKERELGQASWGEVFSEGKNRNISRVLLGAGPYMFNQWSGINSLAYFLPITFERNIGLSSELSLTQWIFIAFCFLFFDIFSWGILPVSWMYASEIMPLRTRNKGVALGVGAHWLSNFVVVYVTPNAIDRLGYKLYIVWAVLNASFVPVTWLFYPETARRSLEDMDRVFEVERFGVTRTRRPGVVREGEGGEEGEEGEERGYGADASKLDGMMVS
ncbi:MAG: hypothetical protein Q9195_006766 [Heterodermia aff. obscurata]